LGFIYTLQRKGGEIVDKKKPIATEGKKLKWENPELVSLNTEQADGTGGGDIDKYLKCPK